VQLEWRSGPVRIQLGGVALQAGTEGEVIRVRVAGRSQPLRGLVIAPGRAVLEGGRP
jgi:flagella basal body P-ring formation protein FlgA